MNGPTKEQIFSCRRYGKASNTKVVFFFCAMLTRIWQYRWLYLLMNKYGYTVYAYGVQEKKIFTTYSAADFGEFVGSIRHSVEQQIELEKRQGADTFVAFGVSMGTIYALDCAKYLKDISKLIINLTYGSIAYNVWTYRFHRPTKARFVREWDITTEEDLREALGPTETAHNLWSLRGKPVLLYTSKTDRVLTDTMKFKEALRKSGAQATYYDSIFGHYLAGLLNLARTGRWRSFLAQ